jgi:hypothetical protein
MDDALRRYVLDDDELPQRASPLGLRGWEVPGGAGPSQPAGI